MLIWDGLMLWGMNRKGFGYGRVKEDGSGQPNRPGLIHGSTKQPIGSTFLRKRTKPDCFLTLVPVIILNKHSFFLNRLVGGFNILFNNNCKIMLVFGN